MDVTGFKAHHFTIIGQNTKLVGEIFLQDESQLWGEIEGSITTQEKMFIERTASIKGKLTCKDVIISGSFSGEINSTGIVTLRSSANFEGQIQADDIIVHPGAKVEANMKTAEIL